MTANSGAMLAWLFTAVMLGSSPLIATRSSAQTCGAEYTIKSGDTLAGIARTVYGNAGQWNVIYYANQDRLGDNASLLVPGLSLKIPCLPAWRGGTCPRNALAHPLECPPVPHRL
jgi:hypothetical protein